MDDNIGSTLQERRLYHRYDGSSLTIKLKDNDEIDSEVIQSILDFNRHGMALCTNQSYKIGDTLDFILSDQTGNHLDITGFICNRAPVPEGFRYGFRFLEANHTRQSLAEALFQIEQVLEKQAS
jgi:hypothetical protein